jgi:NADH-quinone oxidoreductase subunit G
MAIVTITIDGARHEVDDDRNLLDICLSLGYDVPYFCWHPAMGSIGACRQCAVKLFWDDDDQKGEIVMACLTRPREGNRVAISDEDAVRFRATVIELLMVSHPHDCPICDEGGECHLQDMTVMTGHVYRRYPYRKRTFENHDLGPFVTHEMNRCIQCYRCLRFYADYAGGHDFGAFGLRNEVYFGRLRDGALESEFSGNLVEICPVGVFDDKTFAAHYTRKWDLQTAPAVCAFCGRGCNTIAGERYGELRRVLNRFNGEVNGYFLCDRGRYAYESVNGTERVRRPIVGLAGLSASELVRGLGARLESAFGERRLAVGAWPRVARPRPVGIGSPRASLEANFALKRLVGAERFFLGLADGEQTLVERAAELLRQGPSPAPTLHDIEAADLVIVLGEDLTNTAPMLDLSVRRWARLRPTIAEERLGIARWNDAGVGAVKKEEPSALWLATTHAGKLDETAAETFHAAPDDLARFALALATALGPSAGSRSAGKRRAKKPVGVPAATGTATPEAVATDAAAAQEAARIERYATALRAAQRPVVISGVSCGSLALLEAAAALARALPGPPPAAAAPLALVVPEVNTMGLVLLGGRRLSEAFRLASEGDVEVALVIENDLYRRAPAAEVESFLQAAGTAIVIDHVRTATAAGAAAVLPAASWAESTGTFVSHEGRAQRSFQVMVPPRPVQPTWRWLSALAGAARLPAGQDWLKLDDVLAELARERPDLAPAALAAPPADTRIAGMRIARQASRFSGRTAMHADVSVFEPAPPVDHDAPLSFSMEGYRDEPPAALVPRYYAPRWNSVQALNKFQQEVGGPLRGGDPGVRLIEPPSAPSPGAAKPGSAGSAAATTAAASRAAAVSSPPAADAALLAGPGAPEAFRPSPDRLLAVPLHHVFGSEELSMLSPPVAGRAPAAYLALSAADAERLDAAEGRLLTVLVNELHLSLPVRIMASLPEGVAGLPVGLPGQPFLALPAELEVERQDGHA